MKKATNPLALDLRAGGFEVFPLVKLFDLPSIPDELPHADAFTDSFRARCASLPPVLPPQAPSLSRPTRQMSHSEWLAMLDEKHPVVDLAHSLCLPRGELKEKVSSMVAERFQLHSSLKAEAQKMLNSYLAASALAIRNLTTVLAGILIF